MLTGHILFANENRVNFHVNILRNLLGKKSLHIGEEKRYLSSSSYITSKSLPNHLKQKIDSMYAKFYQFNDFIQMYDFKILIILYFSE